MGKIVEGPNFDLPTCANYEDENKRRREQDTGKDHLRSMAHYYSLAGQVSHRNGCMDLIRKEEQATNQRFDAVIFSRVDLTAYAPLNPYCTYNYTHGARRIGWDWFFITSRAKADILFSEPYKTFYGCERNLKIGGDTPIWFMPFFQETSCPEVFDIPVFVTRIDMPGMPNQMFCDPYFRNLGAVKNDPSIGDLCASMTWRNKFNKLH